MGRSVSYAYIEVDLGTDRSVGNGRIVTDQNQPVTAFAWLVVPAGAVGTFSIGPSNDKIDLAQDLAFEGGECVDASAGIYVQNSPQVGVICKLYVEYGGGAGSQLTRTAA